MKIYLISLILIYFLNFVKGQGIDPTWPSETYVPNSCICAPMGQCSFGGGGAANDGTGQLDARIINTNVTNTTTGTTSKLCRPVSTGIPLAAFNSSTCAANLDRCCPPMGYTCGIRYPPVQNAPTPSSPGQAAYGAYPYQVVILTQRNEYIGSGVAIDQNYILTAAHKLFNISSQLKIRMGDWDASNIIEPFTPIEINITFAIHQNFTIGNLKNNIALIRTESPIPLGMLPTIGSICLPNVSLSDMRCWTSGWGKNDFNSNGVYQDVIKETDVPLVDHATCQEQLRATKLGKNFMLDRNSFICAGGEMGKDACTGDGGAPLACYVFDRFYLVGLVAWGIGCGQANIPGVYVNIQTYVPWIQQMTANYVPTFSNQQSRISTTVSSAPGTSSVAATTPPTPATSTSSTVASTTASSASTPSTSTSTTTPTTTMTSSTTRTTVTTPITTRSTTPTTTTTEEETTEEESEEPEETEETEEEEETTVEQSNRNAKNGQNNPTTSVTKPTIKGNKKTRSVTTRRTTTSRRSRTTTTTTRQNRGRVTTTRKSVKNGKNETFTTQKRTSRNSSGRTSSTARRTSTKKAENRRGSTTKRSASTLTSSNIRRTSTSKISTTTSS